MYVWWLKDVVLPVLWFIGTLSIVGVVAFLSMRTPRREG